MKYTICGFSQEQAVKMVSTEERNGKTVTVRIDAVDLLILRWFVDFYPRMNKKIIDGREYAWLKHSELESDMPILGISKRSCIARMKKLVKFHILDYALVKKDGTWSYYTFGTAYEKLVTSSNRTTDGMQSNAQGVCNQTYEGACNQTYNKDPSTRYPSTRDSVEKPAPKEPKEQRHKYGEYGNVLLTDTDMSKLKAEFPKDWSQRIDRLSEYMESTGKGYRNHLATIRAWARKDAKEEKKRIDDDPYSEYAVWKPAQEDAIEAFERFCREHPDVVERCERKGY